MKEIDFPDWSAFTPEKAAADLPRLLSQAEVAVAALEASAPADYESLVWALDDATRELYRTWGQVGHLTSVMNSDAWRKVEEDFQGKIVAFSLRVGQSRPLYDAAKRILAERRAAPPSDETEALRATRDRILEKTVEAAEHAGVGLDGAAKERFNEIQAALAKLATDFSNAVLDATKAFSFEKDGKTYTIDDASYPETMKHCADREVREVLCRARATRASENEARIGEILRLRAELAKILGFGSYAELSLATKCAPSVAAAMKMIDDLDAATAASAEREREELQTHEPDEPQTHEPDEPQAKEANAAATIAPWDVAFLAERLREKKYAYSEEELKKHFELEDVLRGLFNITNLLFGVDVEELTGDAKPSVWHPDVRFFAVKEKGETIAHFYFDPFVRNGLKNGGAWMNEFRNRRFRNSGNGEQGTGNGERGTCFAADAPSSANAPELPLALVCTNFPLPDADGRCLLPFREVETLFHEFGHALQCMLTRVDEEDAAGISLVEWDAVEVASQFMENWCLDDRTGIAVPADLKAKVRAAKNFRAASACRRQLAFAQTDLLLHETWGQAPQKMGTGPEEKRGQTPWEMGTGPEEKRGQTPAKHGDRPRQNMGTGPEEKRGQAPGDVGTGPERAVENDVKERVFAHFGVPTVEGDRFLCSFTHIFAGGYAAGYYGYKWAEVMSADCYGAFEEAGLADDAAVRRVGAAYRETVLALGGSKSAIDVFRAFRGRDPEIAALLRQQGLLDSGDGQDKT